MQMWTLQFSIYSKSPVSNNIWTLAPKVGGIFKSASKSSPYAVPFRLVVLLSISDSSAVAALTQAFKLQPRISGMP